MKVMKSLDYNSFGNWSIFIKSKRQTNNLNEGRSNCKNHGLLIFHNRKNFKSWDI